MRKTTGVTYALFMGGIILLSYTVFIITQRSGGMIGPTSIALLLFSFAMIGVPIYRWIQEGKNS